MSADLSFFALILNASLVVQLVMLLLIILSLLSWSLIWRKYRTLTAARNEAEAFEDKFWSGTDLNRLYQEMAARQSIQGMASLFTAGFKEFVLC